MLFVFHLFLCTATRKRKNSSSLDSYEDPKKTNYGSKPMLEKVSYSLDLKDDQKCYNASKQEEYSVDKIDYYVKNDVSLSDACVNIRVRDKIFNENSELTTEDAFIDSIELQEEDSRPEKHTIVSNLDCFFEEENSFNLEPDSPLSNSLLSLEDTKNGVNELYDGDNNSQIVIADNYTSFITNEKEKIDNSNVTNNQILSLDMHNYFNKDGNVEENVEEFKFSDCDLKILQILDEPIKRYKIIRNVSPSIDKDKHKFCIEFFYYKLRTITNKIKTISKKYSELDDDSYCFYKAIENLEGRFNLKFHRFCNLYVDELRNDSVEILRDHAEHNIKLNLKFFSIPLGNFKYEGEYCNDPNIKLHVYDIITDFNSFLGNYIAKEGRIFTNTYYFGTQYYFKNRSVDARGYYLTILLHFLFDKKNETFILLIPDMYFLINQLINTDFGTSIISKFGVIITKMAYRFEFIKLQLNKEIKTSSNLLNVENLDDIPTISTFILECKLIITCFYLYNLKKNSNVLKHVMFSTFLTFTKIYYKNKFNYLESRELIYSYFFNFDLDFSDLKLFKETFIIENNPKKNTAVSIFKSSVFNEFLNKELKKSINLENFKRTNKIKINKQLLNLITEEDIDLKEINEGFPKLNQKLNTYIIQKLKDILYNCDD